MRSQMIPVVLVALAACSGSDDEGATEETGTLTDDTGTAPEGLEIAGTWSDTFGTEHVIDETTWTKTFPGYPAYVFHVATWDNASAWLVAQNDTANGYNADAWSRFDWTWDGGDLYYCQSVFGAASQADAEAAPSADGGDLDTGCGGFPWTGLVP